jgi:hypothetical protein
MYVLTYELLFGAGRIRGGGSLKRTLIKSLPELQNNLEKMKHEKNATTDEDLLPVEWRKTNRRRTSSVHLQALSKALTAILARFARINTLVDPQQTVLESLRSQGFTVVLEPEGDLPQEYELFVISCPTGILMPCFQQ